MIEILALIVAILAASYTIYDRHQVRQSQKRTEESQKRLEKRLDSPKVVASLRNDEVNSSCLIVCVENVGTGTALNVRFDPSYSFQILGEIALEDIGFLKRGIDYFGSGQKYEFLINAIGIWDELIQTPLEITITYEDSAGEEHVENAYLDFGALEKLPLVKSPIGAIAGTAKEMVKVTKEMVKATKDIGRKLNQYTHIRAGDKVITNEELKGAIIDGDYRRRTTIPKDAICTVLEVTQEEITIEWDDAPEEGGRVVYRGWRTLSEPFTVEKINLPPKQ